MVDWAYTLDQILAEKEPHYAKAADIAYMIKGFTSSVTDYTFQFLQERPQWFVDGVDVKSMRKFYEFTQQDTLEIAADAEGIFQLTKQAEPVVWAELIRSFPDAVRDYINCVRTMMQCFVQLSFRVEEPALVNWAKRFSELATVAARYGVVELTS
ncbi:hypothetical protein HYY73_03270 [Candidatus Woesearchaeota archaeon]|nr:hypothetical protein [Candidatus Woesearchaeota archaeon]